MEDSNFNAVNYTPINVADYKAPSQNTPPKKRSINFLNLALLFLTCTSLLGLAYLVRSSQTSVNTDASVNQNSNGTGTEKAAYKFPRMFRGIPIPDSLYQTAKTNSDSGEVFIDDYIKDQIIKFYAYKYTLDENNIESNVPDDVADFTTLRENVVTMEQLIRENLVTSYDFAYIIARYSSDSPDSKEKASSLINSYKTKLQDSTDLQSIVDEANDDAELTALNVTDKSQYITNYDLSASAFPTDSSFNTSLTAQELTKVSEPYILKDQNAVEYGYAVVKIQNINKKKYTSLMQIIGERTDSFAY